MLGPVNIKSGGYAADIVFDNSLSGLSAKTVQGAIDEMIGGSPIIDHIPTQAAALHYNGGSQTPSWINYDDTKLDISGSTSGTSVGEYSATFTPKTGYKWFDGTTGGKTATWRIVVAVLPVPKQNGSLEYTGSSRAPAWNSDYDNTKMTLGGTTSAINVGNYEATFDLIDKTNYQWEDGTTSIKTVTWRINKATPAVTAPTAKPNLKYTGSAQTLVNAGSTTGGTMEYSTDGVVFGPQPPSVTNVGNYTVYYRVEGDANYNDVAPQSISASIAKADGSLTLNKSSLSLGIASLTGTITATGTGTITAESSNSTIAQVSKISGGVITITAKKTGTVTITVHCAASAQYTAASDETCSVVVDIPSGNLADNTPAQIQAVAQAGVGSSYWSVGDKIKIDFGNVTVGALSMNGLSAYAFIIGFNHNQSIEGKGIHFQFGKTAAGVDIAFVDSYYLHGGDGTEAAFRMVRNPIGTNAGGWNATYMKQTVCPAFLSALPSAWQNVIASCVKYTDNTGGGADIASQVTSGSGKIWLLSEFEVQGARKYANSAEKNFQKQYAYYANGNSKRKFKHNDATAAALWWLRSPSAADANRFCHVGDGPNGLPSTSLLSNSYGFAPGFMVG